MKTGRTILVLIDLVQDLDVLWPVLEGLRSRPDVTLRLVVSRWLGSRSPRISQRLRAAGLAFHAVARSSLLNGRAPALEGVDIVLTASESTAGPHRWCHSLVVRAKAAGIDCFTLQHGLDNLEVLARRGDAGFASDVMFCWPPESEWPAGLNQSVRDRLVPSGRPAPPPPEPARFDVGVFENLHAKTYSEEDRQAVLARLTGLALARPALRLYVRSHPAGGWFDRAAERFAGLPNVTFVSSAAARREVETGRAAPAAALRVITTPSTIALDAAQAGRTVALALDGGPLYRPLPVLDNLADWIEFADGPAGADVSTFVSRHVAPTDAVSLIVDRLGGAEVDARRPRSPIPVRTLAAAAFCGEPEFP
jgi:hypothetical protein